MIKSLIYFVFVLAFCFGCKKYNTPQTVNIATDYSQASHWLSIPAPVMAVDVFYLYPTCWQKVALTDPNI